MFQESTGSSWGVLTESAASLSQVRQANRLSTHMTDISDVFEFSLDDFLAVDVDGVGAAAGPLGHQQGGDWQAVGIRVAYLKWFFKWDA